jgi:hypothetical protein
VALVCASAMLSAAGPCSASWSRPQQLFASFGLAPQAGIDARGNAVVAFMSYRTTAHGGAVPGTTRLMLSERRAGHRFGAARRIGRPGSLSLLDLAESPAGAVAVLFIKGGRSPALELLYRPPGGRFGAAETVGPNPSPFDSTTALGIDGRGNVTVVWEDFARHEVLARLRRAKGHFGSVQPLGPRRSQHPALGVNARGDAIAAWSQPSGLSTERGTPLFQARASLRPAGRSRFGQSHVVSGPAEIAAVAGAVGPRGNALVGWLEADPNPRASSGVSTGTIHVAERPVHGGFGAGEVVAPGNISVGLAFDARGTAIAYWTRALCGPGCPSADDVHFVPEAAFRAPGQRFGPVLDLGVQDAGAAFGSDARGNWFAVVERMERNSDQHGVLTTTREPGGTFGRLSPITTEPAYAGATLAVNAAGDAVAAWNAKGRDSRVHASFLRR